MSQIKPYIIHHFQLEQTNQPQFPDINEAGYYCVFWWKQIPLGHLYLRKGDKFTTAQLQQKTLDAIKPAIDFDRHKNSITTDYEQAFLQKASLFYQMMDAVFAASIPALIPNTVPVSVVICTRNRSESLKKCLESLQHQVCMPQEIIVIDNAPTDNSTQLVAEQFSTVSYYKELRPGLDIARNTGAKNANYPLVAYTDDDVQVHPLWTYRVWEAFANENVHAITGLVISTSLDTESQQIFEKHWGFNKGYIDICFDQNFLKKPAPKVWEIGAGANMAFRKEVLTTLNFFDERLDVGAAGCSGDSEMWYRILAAGYNIQYVPLAVVFHEHRNQMAALHKQVFNYMRGHAASVLIQHDQNPNAGYKKYLYYDLPKYYLHLLIAGFPTYPFQYQTWLSEVKGIISGVKFYKKNKT